MWAWFDGHLLAVWVACPVLAYGICGWINARRVRRSQKRAEILSRRGAR